MKAIAIFLSLFSFMQLSENFVYYYINISIKKQNDTLRNDIFLKIMYNERKKVSAEDLRCRKS
jgi:hypothetical protein